MDNKLLISEERLKEIIKEELGIAKEVIELTKIIEDKLNLFLKSKKLGLSFIYLNFTITTIKNLYFIFSASKYLPPAHNPEL